MTYKFQLPNGIRCVCQRVKSTVVYCGMTIGAGSRDESKDEYGMAHLIEHSLFKGTRKRKAYHINNRLENLGGELNAFTTKEETVVHATTLKTDFSKAAELIADVVFNSVFPQTEVEREKEVILDEINSYKDSPGERIFDDFEDRIFAGSSLGHNILGNKKAISRYTSADIVNFVNRTYNTDRMVFSCVGNISEKHFREVCTRYFSSAISKPSLPGRDIVKSAPAFQEIIKRSTFQAHCVLGVPAYGYTDEKRFPLSLLVNMLGGMSANSILNTAVREKNGLAYNIEAGYTAFYETGAVTIYFGTERDNLDKCLELVGKEIRKIISGDITQRRLSVAKKQFIGQLFISNEMGEGLMLGAGKSYLVYDDVDPVEKIAQRVNSITLNDLTEAAKEVFGGGMSSLIYK